MTQAAVDRVRYLWVRKRADVATVGVNLCRERLPELSLAAIMYVNARKSPITACPNEVEYGQHVT
jgi:hypothetical protein